MDIKKMGIFLKQLRKEKGMTQEQLAQMLNVAGRTVSRWETGSNLPDLDILITLSLDRGRFSVLVRKVVISQRKSINNFKSGEKNTQNIEPSPVLRLPRRLGWRS